MAEIDVTLTVSVNGGAPQQGGIVAALGNTIQCSAVSKVGWGGGPTRWEIYSYPPTFALPAGWTAAADGVYYVLGNDDPPTFTATPWGKYLTRVVVQNGTTDERTMVSVLSTNGLPGIARREGAQLGGTRLQWVRDLMITIHGLVDAVAAGAGFNPQATPVQNITTSGVAGTTNIATRNAEVVNIGTGSASTVNVGQNGGGGTTIQGLSELDGAGNDVIANASSWLFSPTAGFEAHGPTAGLLLDSTALGVSIRAGGSAAIPAAGQVLLTGSVGIDFDSPTLKWKTQPLGLQKTVRVITTANVNLAASGGTHDGVALADGDRVGCMGQTVLGEKGTYRYNLAANTFTRTTDFDAVTEWVLGTTVRSVAGSANKGKIYQLEALNGLGTLPEVWSDVSGSGSGGGASIAHATSGTFGFLGSAGILSGTSLVEANISVTGEVVLGGGTGTYLGHVSTGETVVRGPTCKIGPSASSIVIDVSGVSTRVVVPDAAGVTALTSLHDNLANSHAYTGSLTTTSTGAMTFTPSSTLMARTTVGDATFGTLDGKVTIYAGGAGNFCQIFSNVRRVEFCATATGEPAVVFFHPVPVTPVLNTATSLGAYTIPANKLVRVHGSALAWLSAGNAKTFAIEALIDGSATAVVTASALATQKDSVGTCQGVGAAAPLAVGNFSTSVSGRVVTFRVAEAQGLLVSVNLRVDILE